MTERSWFWGGTATGDAALPAPYGAPYTDDMFSDVFSFLFLRDRTKQGVIPSTNPSFNGNLGTTFTNSTATVTSGLALVDGKLYASDASVALSFPGDGAFYVVLRKSFLSQTVRLALITQASLTQADGATWDVPIYSVTRAGGVVTASEDIRCWVIHPKSYSLVPMVNANYVDAVYPNYYLFRKDQAQSIVNFFFILPDNYVGNLSADMVLGSATTGNWVKTISVWAQSFVTPSLSPSLYAVGASTWPLTAGVYTNQNIFNGGNFGSSLLGYRGQMINCQVARLATNGSDSIVNSVFVYGIRVTYDGI